MDPVTLLAGASSLAKIISGPAAPPNYSSAASGPATQYNTIQDGPFSVGGGQEINTLLLIAGALFFVFLVLRKKR